MNSSRKYKQTHPRNKNLVSYQQTTVVHPSARTYNRKRTDHLGYEVDCECDAYNCNCEECDYHGGMCYSCWADEIYN